MSAPANQALPPPARPKSWFRFSLRSLMLLMVLVAVYLGGRASMTYRYALAPALDGNWNAKLPAGFVQSTTIQDFGEGKYQFRSRASVFNGLYEWQNGLLVVVEPTDERMVGLVWKWDGNQLLLVGEPKNTPTGASYVGTVLSRPPDK